MTAPRSIAFSGAPALKPSAVGRALEQSATALAERRERDAIMTRVANLTPRERRVCDEVLLLDTIRETWRPPWAVSTSPGYQVVVLS